ncbi:hypothetical protein SmJEL517_g04266 [Synchytrium microbalum]|uniref:Ubiquitin carboxyl-terminal hydrolase n=1 Tax=Synchytrium microbalum TaxID=1806994 RepID=A0A507C3C5_9FUNG|nr:uncharacterized protein SmJEL517_g04266 [Synchytrium microbalum]TPX32594.1 hypothetical protein SmJEL517_g04266 [Synchytrium microbalum]
MAPVWIPLESNPAVWNKYIANLGVNTDSWCYSDIWGLDEDILQFVPKPVIAVLLLFPVTDKYEQYRREEEAKIKKNGQTVSDKIWFTRQTIENACGTIGLLHSLANNSDVLQVEKDGGLSRILHRTGTKSADDRAEELEKDQDLAKAHDESSREGQSEVPDAEEDVDLHFVCFVKQDECLYELDGRKPFPINHGPCTDLLKGAATVIRQFMDREPESVNFNMISLGGVPADD